MKAILRRRKLTLGCGLVVLLGLTHFLAIVGFAAIYINGRTPSDTDLARSVMRVKPPPPLSGPVTLKVATFNIHSLPVVGYHRPTRMAAIGDALTALEPDIVCFQEAFIEADRRLLIQHLEGSRLAHYHYYPSATVGSGLMIASAYPIKEVFFHRYTVSNSWYKLWEGDWWAGKGVGLARIALPQGGVVDIYDTHAQAGYGLRWYDGIRNTQMSELAEFIKATRTKTGPALLLGDMNSRINTPYGYNTIVHEANLVRLMAFPKSIDHIFGVLDGRYSFELVDSVRLHRHDGVRLSDHDGYVSTIRITPHVPPSAVPLTKSTT